METPLDVLSRAATMVETDKHNGSATMRSDDLRTEVSKELPSRINRQRRSTERRELAQVLRFDDLHNNTSSSSRTATMVMDTAAAVSTRCAGTQTDITSMRIEDNDVVGIPEVNPALPTPSTSHLAPLPIHLPNVSAANGRKTTTTAPQCRPSVITCAPLQPREGTLLRDGPPHLRTNGYTSTATSNHCRDISLDVCDPVIEEHFRRSLGKDYKESLAVGARTSPSTSPDSVVTMITGSVDDHFAKALGDKWPQIKNVMEPVANSGPLLTVGSSSQPSSCLAHPPSVMST